MHHHRIYIMYTLIHHRCFIVLVHYLQPGGIKMKRTIAIALVLACIVSMAFASVDSNPEIVAAADVTESAEPAEVSSDADTVAETADGTAVILPLEASQEVPAADNTLSTPAATV